MNKGVKENKRGGYVLLRKREIEKKSVTFLYVQEEKPEFWEKGEKPRTREKSQEEV